MANLFTGARHALQYKKYRPTYPPEVYQTIINYCKKGSNTCQAAVDVGCGSGQSTLPLTAHFKHVTGLDPSESQIREAEKCHSESTTASNVSFKIGTAEDLSGLEPDSVDLITFAQSIHWVDVKSLYHQAKRVLRHSGVLVAYGYGNIKVDSEKANDILWEFYKGTVGPYWDSRRHHIDNHLAEISFPFPEFTRDDNLKIERRMPISALVGYVSSWSAYQTYMKQHPEADILEQLQQKLCEAYNTDEAEKAEVHATWPVFMLLGRHLATASN